MSSGRDLNFFVRSKRECNLLFSAPFFHKFLTGISKKFQTYFSKASANIVDSLGGGEKKTRNVRGNKGVYVEYIGKFHAGIYSTFLNLF